MQPNIASEIPQSSIEGALFELMARGKKDVFFVKDAESSTFIANPRYKPCIPFLEERRTIVPLNAQNFGSSFEVEIDSYGDIMTYCGLLIDLPSWYPPLPVSQNPSGQQIDPSIVNNLYWITDMSGQSYGYCRNIGYMLFENIQVYQDQILIQEWSGDGLFVEQSTEGSWNSSNLGSQISGGVELISPARALAQRATPTQLRITIPMPGIDLAQGSSGFPLCSVPGQTFRIKCRLRKLEDLVESTHDASSMTTLIKPAPWTVPLFKYNLQTSMTSTTSTVEYTFAPLQRDQISRPTILLETVQAYIPQELRDKIQHKPRWIIPFRQQYENRFTIGANDYKPFDSGNIPAISRRLDGRHITERLQWFFRTKDAVYMNRLSDFTDPSGYADDTIGMEGNGREFYNQIKLIIAGRDREHLFGPGVWRNMVSLAKDEIDTGYLFGEMRWNLGDLWERERPVSRLPEGGVNFSTADRPTLYIQLADIPVSKVSGIKEAELRVFCEAWNMYVIEGGRGRMMFAN
jgi:hypothetical protein